MVSKTLIDIFSESKSFVVGPPHLSPTSSFNENSFPSTPPRPPPRPEKYLKSQLCSWNSVPTFDPVDSTTGDSSLSSNPNLSRRSSSDVSFSDEEADFVSERVCLIFLHLFNCFSLFRFLSKSNYVDLSKKFIQQKKLM